VIHGTGTESGTRYRDGNRSWEIDSVTFVTGLTHACRGSVGVKDGLDAEVRKQQINKRIYSGLRAMVMVWT